MEELSEDELMRCLDLMRRFIPFMLQLCLLSIDAILKGVFIRCGEHSTRQSRKFYNPLQILDSQKQFNPVDLQMFGVSSNRWSVSEQLPRLMARHPQLNVGR